MQADVASRVGRRRGTADAALFRRPPAERRVPVPPHTARQSARSQAGQPTASRILRCRRSADRSPVALCAASPRSPVGRHSDDDDGDAAAVGRAPGRPARLPSASDVRARRRCPTRPRGWARCPPPARRRVRAPAAVARYPGGPAAGARRGTCPGIAGDWGSGRLPRTLARRPRESGPYAPPGCARLPTMLVSPVACAARSGGRPRSHIPPNFSPLRGGSMTG
jgi:hypothetical protein